MAYTAEKFLEKIKPLVIADMKSTGILASLTAAQAFIESGIGNSKLTETANNLFGIKGSYNGNSVTMKTTEYYNGVKQTVYAAFRAYPSWIESIADHSGLFNRLARYSNLRGLTNYKLACEYVHADGYATAPDYANTLMGKINTYRLYEWDGEALGKIIPIQTVPALPTLRKGDRNDYVLHWQKYLNAVGFFCGNEDGIFGANTEIAVKDLQMSKGIKADGIIGKATWNSIGIAA